MQKLASTCKHFLFVSKLVPKELKRNKDDFKKFRFVAYNGMLEELIFLATKAKNYSFSNFHFCLDEVCFQAAKGKQKKICNYIACYKFGVYNEISREQFCEGAGQSGDFEFCKHIISIIGNQTKEYGYWIVMLQSAVRILDSNLALQILEYNDGYSSIFWKEFDYCIFCAVSKALLTDLDRANRFTDLWYQAIKMYFPNCIIEDHICHHIALKNEQHLELIMFYYQKYRHFLGHVFFKRCLLTSFAFFNSDLQEWLATESVLNHLLRNNAMNHNDIEYLKSTVADRFLLFDIAPAMKECWEEPLKKIEKKLNEIV